MVPEGHTVVFPNVKNILSNSLMGGEMEEGYVLKRLADDVVARGPIV